ATPRMHTSLLTTMSQNGVVVTPSIFQGVRQDGQVLEATLLVDEPGQRPHEPLTPAEPFRVDGRQGVERVAQDATHQATHLRPLSFRGRPSRLPVGPSPTLRDQCDTPGGHGRP